MKMNVRVVCVVIAALGLTVGVGGAVADNPGATRTLITCAAAQGSDEQQAAAEVSQAADDVELEAESQQADDEAGDVDGAQARQGAQADDDQCDDQGDDNQGDDDSGD